METIGIGSILHGLQLASGIHKAVRATYLTIQATYLLLPGQWLSIAIGILTQHILGEILLLCGRDHGRALRRIQAGVARVQCQAMGQAKAAGEQEKNLLQLHVVNFRLRGETLRLGHSPRLAVGFWLWQLQQGILLYQRPRLDAVTGSSSDRREKEEEGGRGESFVLVTSPGWGRVDCRLNMMACSLVHLHCCHR